MFNPLAITCGGRPYSLVFITVSKNLNHFFLPIYVAYFAPETRKGASSNCSVAATRGYALRALSRYAGWLIRDEGFPVAPQGTRGTDLRRCQAGTNPSNENTNALTLYTNDKKSATSDTGKVIARPIVLRVPSRPSMNPPEPIL